MRLCLFLFLCSSPVWAASFDSFPHSQARLLQRDAKWNIGQENVLGFHVLLEDHWHTYFEHPGDSGSKPFFTVIEPKGYEVTSVRYPVPVRVDSPPLTSYAYKEEVLFLLKVKNPNETVAPDKLVMQAEWLVCENECVPAMGKLAMQHLGSSALNIDVFEAFAPRFPAKKPLQATYTSNENGIAVNVETEKNVEDVFLLPGALFATAKPDIASNEKRSSFSLMFESEKTVSAAPQLLLRYQDGTGNYVALKQATAAGQVTKVAQASTPFSWRTFLLAVFSAFLGGLILNVMPCVFPILSIKVMGLLNASTIGRQSVRRASIWYVLGVLATFGLVALVLVSLLWAGHSLGWGFQLQSPVFVAALVFLFVLLALHYFGLFEIFLPGADLGQEAASKDSAFGHFASGALAVLVASPCTAPFMGAALGFALSQSLPVVAAIFLSLGLGFAFPYILLAIYPAALQRLPKPGAWLEACKIFMAFPMLATALWLSYVLLGLSHVASLFAVFACALFMATLLWLHKRSSKLWLRWALLAALLVGVATCLLFVHRAPNVSVRSSVDDASFWREYSPETVAHLRQDNVPVFVDFTADWCITCKVNESVTFSRQQVQEFVDQKGIVMLKADWTKKDPIISKALAEFSRASVPFYVFYPANNKEPIILPEILTPSIFMSTLAKHL